MPYWRTLVSHNFRRFQRANRQRLERILDEFVEQTLYARANAALVLRKRSTKGWSVGPRGLLR